MEQEEDAGTLKRNGVLDSLISADVLVPVDDGTELKMGDGFAGSVDREISELRELDIEDFRRELACIGHRDVSQVSSLDGRLLRFVAVYRCVNRKISAASPSTKFKITVLLLQLPGFPPTDGVPDPFFPISGEYLGLVPSLIDKSIIYVWRDDCEPCEIMASDLEDHLSESQDDICLFAVYGPESSRLLQEEYGVVGGPTTLFMEDGTVETRLEGAQYAATSRNEIEKFIPDAGTH